MIGVIILNYNTPDDVECCVRSLYESTRSDFRIYIVDNMSSDGSYERLKNTYADRDDISVILSDINGGYSYGNNIGIKAAVADGCDYILISNPDIVYYANAVDIMRDYLKNNDDIGIVGPSCASLDSDESQLFRKVYNNKLYIFSKKPMRALAKPFKSLRTEYTPPHDCDDFKFFGMVRGCCFMVSAALFEEMDYFDPAVFLYAEEWILAKKLQTRGLKCACVFEAKVLHKEATSTDQKGSAFKTKHLYLSEFYYMKMYNRTAYPLLFIYYIANLTMFFVRAIFRKDYRKFLSSFRKTSNRLMFSNRSKENDKNKIKE